MIIDRETTREIARLSPATMWFPEGFVELIVHRKSLAAVVTVLTREPDGRIVAHMEHFSCRHVAACAYQIQLWLRVLTRDLLGRDERHVEWADDVTRTIESALRTGPPEVDERAAT